ncbi:ABC transporter substrate-binding protein [Cohnella silvisoli]|uniref:Extracellular solute-binding protein n=1 Tax=Cohnella silvisoli TaxID=2873699 RepID=A0ABV1KLL5_9BACL|nr:extracellular solute-binding protein [Cohnella silvisoli]MCD9020670.1 extracellular solute-binding protein [Cohnella silvisoli]
MKQKKLYSTLTLSLLILCLLAAVAGCGTSKNNNSSSQPGTDAQTNSPAASSSNEKDTADKPKVKLKFMHWWAYVDDKIIAEFEKQNPDIEVENMYIAPGDTYANKLQALAATNDLPDVFAPSDKVPFLVKQGQLLDLNEYLKTPAYDTDKSWGDTQSKTLMQQITDSLNNDMVNMPEDMKPKNNHFWSLPFGAISIAMVYNKNIYEKVGIQEPKDFQEFLSNNDKLRTAGYIPISVAGKIWGDWFFSSFLDQTGRDYSSTDNPFLNGTFKNADAPYVKEAVSAYSDMISRKHFDEGMASATIEDSQQLFVQQKAAQIYIVPENFVTYLVENKPKDVTLGAFPLPGLKGLPARSLGGAPNNLSISAKTANQEAAVKFAKFMTSTTVFQLLASQKVVPSVEGYVPPADDTIMSAYAKAYENGFASPVTVPFSADATAKINNELLPTLVFEHNVDDFMTKYAKLWDVDANNPKNKK